MALNFGLGSLTLIPSGANPTPVQIAVLKDVSIEFAFDTKKMRGQFQAPIDVARAALDISVKAKNANVRGDILLAALPAATTTTGSLFAVANEAGTIGSSPNTVTVANSANFSEDLGVIDLTSGKSMARVASAPTTGQYSVSAGVYTFAAADANHNVAVSYSYTSTSGKTISMNNAVMGQSTAFAMRCFQTYNGKSLGFSFPAVHVPKLAFAMKAEDYTEQDLEIIVAQATTGSKVFDVYVGE